MATSLRPALLFGDTPPLQPNRQDYEFPGQKDNAIKRLDELMKVYSPGSLTFAEFEKLRKWDVFQKASKISIFSQAETPRIRHILIYSGEEKWAFVIRDGDSGADLVRISQIPGETSGSLQHVYTLKEEGDKLVAVPASYPIKPDLEKVRESVRKHKENLVKGSESVVPATGRLLEPVKDIKIAPEGTAPDKLTQFDYYWNKTKLCKTAGDKQEVGYKVAELDVVFFHAGNKPDAEGHHKDQDQAWVLYTKDGKGLGRYSQFDLNHKDDNIRTLTVDSQTIKRLELKGSVKTIKEYDVKEAAKLVGTYQAFQFLAGETSAGGPTRAFAALNNGNKYQGQMTGGEMRVSKVPPPAQPATPPKPVAFSDNPKKGSLVAGALDKLQDFVDDWVSRGSEQNPSQVLVAYTENLKLPLNQKSLKALLEIVEDVAGVYKQETRQWAAEILSKKVLEGHAQKSEQLAIVQTFQRVLRQATYPPFDHSLQKILSQPSIAGFLLPV